jgi:hypothetical protein
MFLVVVFQDRADILFVQFWGFHMLAGIGVNSEMIFRLVALEK